MVGHGPKAKGYITAERQDYGRAGTRLQCQDFFGEFAPIGASGRNCKTQTLAKLVKVSGIHIRFATSSGRDDFVHFFIHRRRILSAIQHISDKAIGGIIL